MYLVNIPLKNFDLIVKVFSFRFTNKIKIVYNYVGDYMKRYNVIAVFNANMNKILMCYRSKEPYKGLYNLVGGKIEDGEEDLEAAYRELVEETNISKDDIKLTYLMKTIYNLNDVELQVYVGRLNKDVNVVDEVNKLHWIDLDNNFFDVSKFAGEGNIGHMIEQINLNKDKIFE